MPLPTDWTHPTTRHCLAAMVTAWLVITCLTGTSQATVLLQDTFTYPDGDLTANGWTALVNAGSKPIQVISEEARLEVSSGVAEIDAMPLGAARSATDKTYLGGIVRIPSTAPSGGAPVVSGSTRLFEFVDNVGVRHTSVSVLNFSGWYFAVTGGFSLFDPGTIPTLNADENYIVISAYDASNGDMELWVNPSSEADPHVVGAAGDAVGAEVDRVALEQRNTTAANLYAHLDNITVADNFTDVLNALAGSPTVPAASPLALGGLTLLFGGFGAWAVRRRALRGVSRATEA